MLFSASWAIRYSATRTSAERGRAFLRSHRTFDLQTSAGSRGLAQLTQQILQRKLRQCARSKLDQQRAHLRERTPRQSAQFFEPPASLQRVALPEVRNHFGNQGGREKRLGDGVVESTRQALTLLEGGCLLGLFVQPSILDRQRRALGKRIEERFSASTNWWACGTPR